LAADLPDPLGANRVRRKLDLVVAMFLQAAINLLYAAPGLKASVFVLLIVKRLLFARC
jgi:hypothetical protein